MPPPHLDLRGAAPERFAAALAAFQRHFAEDLELGAGLAVAVDGEILLDVTAGWADRARTQSFDARTLVPLFSTSKAIASLLIAAAVDRGLLDYDQPLSELWPAFAQAGKDRLTLAEVLSHQAGLSGPAEPIDPETWFDWDATCAWLAAQRPLWPPTSASGYGPVTFGYLAGEAFRRVDLRGMGAALREDFAEPLELDLAFGAADADLPRVAELMRPTRSTDFGEINAATRAAFVTKGAAVNARDPRYRSMAIPSINAHGTAAALARLFSIVACDGRLDGRTWVSPEVLTEATRERIAGPDLVLPHVMSWAAGFTRGGPEGVFGPNPEAVGHWGWGGSVAFADRQRRLSMAYVMNRQGPFLVKDPRPMRLIEAVYAGL